MKDAGKLAWEIISGCIILAIIYMLARPGSPAATAINDVSSALTALVTTAVGSQAQTQST